MRGTSVGGSDESSSLEKADIHNSLNQLQSQEKLGPVGVFFEKPKKA